MDENMVNDMQEPNVEAQKPVEETGVGAVEQTEKAEQQPQEVAAPAPKQSPEENEQFKLVRQRATQAAREEAQRDADALIADSYQGITDPRTGAPITSTAQLKELFAIQKEQQRSEAIKNAGLDMDVLNSIISDHPAVRQAQTVIEQANHTQAMSKVDAGLQTLTAIDPDIKSFDDIPEDVRPSFEASLNNGLSFVDAYKLAAFDKLMSKKTAAAKQAAINATNSKSHLTQTTGGAGDEIHVPADVMAQYRAYGITEVEAKKHFAQMQKGK